MVYDDDETLTGGDSDSDITPNPDDSDVDSDNSDTSGGSSDSGSGSGSSDNTVFELIVEAEEPASLPAIGEPGCFGNILTKLEDSKNSQTLRYEVNKQEEAAKTTKDYSFGRF